MSLASEAQERIQAKVAAAEKFMQDERQKSLKRILGFCRSTNLSYSSNPWGEGLVFEESGRARLANIAGFLQGLMLTVEGSSLEQLAGAGGTTRQSLAEHLAYNLDQKLRCLADYGGTKEIAVEESSDKMAAQMILVPAYRVVLYDDGTFGGFGVLWHRPYTMDQIKAKAREKDEAAYQGREHGEELAEDVSRTRWDTALTSVREDLRIRKELEVYRHYTPRWAKEERVKAERLHEEHKTDDSSTYMCKHEDCEWSRDRLKYSGRSEYIEYGFAFNGGLLLHGFGNVNAVDLTSRDLPGWGIHT